MPIDGRTREIFKDAIASGPVAKELCDAIDNASNVATIATSLTFAANANEIYNTTNGTMHGTNANQKQSEWGAAPIVQPSAVGELLGLNGNAATAANATNMNSNGNLGTRYWGYNDLIKALKLKGTIATN